MSMPEGHRALYFYLSSSARGCISFCRGYGILGREQRGRGREIVREGVGRGTERDRERERERERDYKERNSRVEVGSVCMT
jgi:hypothetical protein